MNQQKLMEAMRRFDATGETAIKSTNLEFWSVVCAVQLASRHPAANGPTLKIATEWARSVGKVLTANDPDLRLLMDMGWQPQFDELVPVRETTPQSPPPSSTPRPTQSQE